jgi:hypothetical protein
MKLFDYAEGYSEKRAFWNFNYHQTASVQSREMQLVISTDCMNQGSSREASSSSASREIHFILRNPYVPIAFTRTGHLSLSLARSIHSTSYSCLKIHF